MTLTETFEKAVAESKTLNEKPDNEMLLALYSWYKQATEGDAPEKEDYGMFDFVAKAKYEAWSQRRGIAPKEAMQQYIDLVSGLKR